MVAPSTKKYLIASAAIIPRMGLAIVLPWILSDSALANSTQPSDITVLQDSFHGSISADDTSAEVHEFHVLTPETLPPAAPTFYTQATIPPIPESAATPAENSAEDALNDGFLMPDQSSAPGSDADSEELEDEVGDLQPLPDARQTQTPPQPNGQLLIRSSAFTSSNVTGSNLDTTGDIVFVNGATLLITPKLGTDTRLVATVGGGLTRFATEGENNYNSLDASVGVQQRFSDTTYGQVGWVNNQLYSVDTGDRTLSDNSARLLIGRQDQLDEKLRLDSFYELRARFTDPSDRSRISNTVGTRMRYDFSPDWQASLGYRLAFSEYTQNGRADTTHQLQAATTYTPTRDTFVSGFAAYSFGNSSEATVDLSNLSFGIGIGINLPLF